MKRDPDWAWLLPVCGFLLMGLIAVYDGIPTTSATPYVMDSLLGLILWRLARIDIALRRGGKRE